MCYCNTTDDYKILYAFQIDFFFINIFFFFHCLFFFFTKMNEMQKSVFKRVSREKFNYHPHESKRQFNFRLFIYLVIYRFKCSLCSNVYNHSLPRVLQTHVQERNKSIMIREIPQDNYFKSLFRRCCSPL